VPPQSQSQSLADRRTLATYDRESDEGLELALARAFDRVGIDVMERDVPFHGVVDVDALRNLFRNSETAPIRTTLELYDHPVAITTDAVRIYAPGPETE
jgi:hypothetical protein